MVKAGRKYTKKSRRRNSQWPTYVLIGGISIAVVVLVVFLVQSGTQGTVQATTSLMGDVVPVSSRDHIPEGTPPGPYASNPPAGGAHYPTTFQAKFYNESDLASLPKYPEGYLVHDEEHGYVIFWYNCSAPGVTDCNALKQMIQGVMNAQGGTKLIAFPWTTMTVPVALTSWGRILNLTTPTADVMTQFVLANRYQGPEDAP
jgi:hypothetical protein